MGHDAHAIKRELDFFTKSVGYGKYLEQRETVWFHVFLFLIGTKSNLMKKECASQLQELISQCKTC